MTESSGPKRIEVVNADYPMAEVHGALPVRGSHARALVETRDVSQGTCTRAQGTPAQPQQVTFRYPASAQVPCAEGDVPFGVMSFAIIWPGQRSAEHASR